MTDILEQIRAYKLEEIAAAKAAVTYEELARVAQDNSPTRHFAETLWKTSNAGGYGLIAEIKKASPSKGLIRPDFFPGALAQAYAAGGASCLSVLTDAPSFQGSPDFLIEARAAVDLPVLRKDFMYDPFQVTQSRAWGADCILIIMAAVSDAQAAELEEAAFSWEMDALIEVHNYDELMRALQLKSPLIGINNRDLKTFETSVEVTRSLIKDIPAGKIIVSESGFFTREDLASVARFGVRNFLIGESLMRQENVELATRELLSSPWSPEAM